MNIVIAGGSGFVGTALAKHLVNKGNVVTIVDRNSPRVSLTNLHFIKADLMTDAVPSIFAECDAVINLSGATIFNRWTDEYKKIILESRTKAAHAILESIRNSTSNSKPSVYVSASAVGYYGDRGNELLAEDATPGNDFLSKVCVEWENAAAKAEDQGMRRVSIRTAIVVGSGGGMMAKLAPLFKWGIGGRLGSGKQWFSWIHIDDLVEIYATVVTDKNISGAVNASSPGAVINIDFTKAMAHAFHRPAFIPVPAWALKLALGEFAVAVLSSQHVIPKKLILLGFNFQHPTIDSAL